MMTKALFGFLLLPALFATRLFAGTIMTVNGPIDSAELGRALTHEHILVDFIGAEGTGSHRWDREAVANQVRPHLAQAKELGFRAIFEATPAYLGRDPLLLKALSEATGLHLVTNTGYYGARGNKFIPESVRELSADALADRWTTEFKGGIEGTDIKPGFIKIGVDREPTLSPMHEKLLRAACRAHLSTGLTIACHTGPGPVIFEMAAILEEEGVSPDALIWVHATVDSPENQIRAARMGLWVSIDNVTDHPGRISAVTTSLKALKDSGLLDRVLLSHDAGWYRPGEPDGGVFRPYTAISEVLIPRLMAAGFDQGHIDRLLIHNPGRAFDIRVRRKSDPSD